MDRRTKLTQTPVPGLILELSVPTIISMLVTAIYNAADKFFVGRISTEASAAVGVAFPAMAVIQAIGFFYGHGSGNFLSRMMGAGKHKEASEMASTGFCLAILTGLMAALLGIGFVKPLAIAMGATEAGLADSMSYMRIIMIGAPFMMGQFVINNQLRFQGSAMYAMAGLMTGAVINAAHIKAIDSSCKDLGRVWAFSILGEYDRVLRDRYGLYGYYGNEDLVREKLETYAECSFKRKKYIKSGDFVCHMQDYKLMML